MARGPYYTKEEDERLLALWNDLKDQSPTLKEVAMKAVAYGICDRNPDAVAQHLAVLLAPKVEEPAGADEAQLEIDVEKASLSKRASELETKYNGLLHAVVDCAHGAGSVRNRGGIEMMNKTLSNVFKHIKEETNRIMDNALNDIPMTREDWDITNALIELFRNSFFEKSEITTHDEIKELCEAEKIDKPIKMIIECDTAEELECFLEEIHNKEE